MAKDDVDAIVKEIGSKASKILNKQKFSWQDEGSERPIYKVVKVGIESGNGENS